LIGRTLDGKYELISLLGEGGMGAVYEAETTATSQRVAVKLIKTGRLPHSDAVTKRFRREAKAAGAIDCPHVVRILDSGEDEATGDLYMVMEYLLGEDLQRLLGRVGPLPPDVALRVIGQALVGLQKAHEAGIVHRDIKPANIFLAQEGDSEITVKLVDFGIAKVRVEPPTAAAAAAAAPLPVPTTGLTDTGSFLGSPLYMSPEQVHNSKRVDHRTDVWSLGSTLYCTLAGQAPHQHIESPGTLIIAICTEAAPSLKKRTPWVSKAIADFVHRSIAIRPEQRYSSAAAMLEALRPLLSDGLSLRKEMLVGVGAEERALASAATQLLLEDRPSTPTGDSASPGFEGENTASLDTAFDRTATALSDSTQTAEGRGAAPSSRQRHVFEVESSRPILGHESTAPIDTTTGGQEKPGWKVPQPAEGRGRRAAVVRWALGAAAVAAVLVAGFKLAAQREKAPAESAPLASSTPAPVAPLPPPPSAPAPSTAPEPIQHRRLIVLPADASVTVDDVPREVRDGAVEISGKLGSRHKVRITKAGRERREDVVLLEDGVLPQRLELELAKPVAPASKPPTRPTSAASAPAPAPPKPEDSLMPADPR
jgi:eukaryotic-like serine/threonine-protein kinase